MGSAIGLREDFDGPALRRLAHASTSANQARRLLALAEICDGGSRSARCGSAGWACRSCVTGWFGSTPADLTARSMARGRGNGRGSTAPRRALVEVVEREPIPAIHGVVRWRLIDLV